MSSKKTAPAKPEVDIGLPIARLAPGYFLPSGSAPPFGLRLVRALGALAHVPEKWMPIFR